MPRTRRTHTIGIWEHLTGSVTPEVAAGLPHVADALAKLMAFQKEVDRLVQERAFHDGRKQDATRKINETLAAGRIVANLLQAELRQHFGSQNEELVAIGIQPFRGRKRSRKASSSAGTAKKEDAAPEPSGGEPG